MKTRIVTFSKVFPATHPKKGLPTHFMEGILTQLGIDYTSHSYFVELIKMNPGVDADFLVTFWKSFKKYIDPKSHTIRANKIPFKVGEFISAHVWAGKPYRKTTEGYWKIKFAPDFEVKKIWDVQIQIETSMIRHIAVYIPIRTAAWYVLPAGDVAKNDGLDYDEFRDWFKPSLKDDEMHNYQIVCWNNNINY